MIEEEKIAEEEADCEEMAEMASKYGYDILCDDPINDGGDFFGYRAAKLVKRFGYDVVCGVEEE